MGKRENDIAEAVNKAVECFAMTKILEKRIKFIERINRALTITGALLPISISYIAANSDQFNELGKFKELLAAASPIEAVFIIAIGILGLFQTIVSIISLAFKWNDNLPTYINSKIENYKNAEQYCDIYTRYRDDEEKYAKQLEETNRANEAQQKIDLTINISDRERRYGKRCALYRYDIKCPECGEKPNLNKTSNCPDCGK